jgi:pimeloyl-ACP methyl ester carboxylesterase
MKSSNLHKQNDAVSNWFVNSYWNFGNSTYNYISAANTAGFTTLSYDRLGTGASPKADPYSIVQAPVELAILTKITELLRSGNLHRKIPKPKKVVHVGHSYGSSLSNALVATRPELSDGLVTTGYSHNGNFFRDFLINTGFHLARDNSPRFKGYSTGYVTWPDKYSNEYSKSSIMPAKTVSNQIPTIRLLSLPGLLSLRCYNS